MNPMTCLQLPNLQSDAERHRTSSRATQPLNQTTLKRLYSMLEKVDAVLSSVNPAADGQIDRENLPPTTRLSATQAATPLPSDTATAKRYKDGPRLRLAAQPRKPSGAALAAKYAKIPLPQPEAPATSAAATRLSPTAAMPAGQSATGMEGSPGKREWQPSVNAEPSGDGDSSGGSQLSDVEMMDAQEFASSSPAAPTEVAPFPRRQCSGSAVSNGTATDSGAGGHKSANSGRPTRRVADIQPPTPHAPLKPSAGGRRSPGGPTSHVPLKPTAGSRRSPAGPTTPRAEAVHSSHQQQCHSAADPIVLSSGDDEEAPQQRPFLRVNPSPQRPLPPRDTGPAAPAAVSPVASEQAEPLDAREHSLRDGFMGQPSQPAARFGAALSDDAAPDQAAVNFGARAAGTGANANCFQSASVFVGAASSGTAVAQRAARARGGAARTGRGKHPPAAASAPSAAFKMELPGVFSASSHPAASFGFPAQPQHTSFSQQQQQQQPPQPSQQPPPPQPQPQPEAPGAASPAAHEAALGDPDDGYNETYLAQQAHRRGQAQGPASRQGGAAQQAPHHHHPPRPQHSTAAHHSQLQHQSQSPGEGTRDDPVTLSSSDDDLDGAQSGGRPQPPGVPFANPAFRNLFKGMAQSHGQPARQRQQPAAFFGAGAGGRACWQPPPQQNGGFAAAGIPFTSGTSGASQKAKRAQGRRKPVEPFKQAAAAPAVPANPSFAPPPPAQPAAVPQPRSGTWGPPPQTSHPSPSQRPAAAPHAAPAPQPPLFRGASDGMAQRKSPKKKASFAARAGARTTMPPQHPGGNAATSWPPKQWASSANAAGWAQQAAAAAAAAQRPLAPVAPSAGPVFPSTAAASAPAARATRQARQPMRKATVPKPPAARAAGAPESAAATTTAPAAGPAAAVEMAAASEATRAALGAHRLDDDVSPGAVSGMDGWYDEAQDQGGAPEILREQHRSSDAAKEAEAQEWQQRQVEIDKQNAEAKKLKLQRRAAAAQKSRVEERLQEHRQLESKKAAEAQQKDGLRSSLQAALQRRLHGVTTLPAILRVLGLPIDGDPNPSAVQLEKAKKRAQVKFHPDRYQGKPVQVLIEAEEIFKIINDAPMTTPRPAYQSYSGYKHTSQAGAYGYASYGRGY